MTDDIRQELVETAKKILEVGRREETRLALTLLKRIWHKSNDVFWEQEGNNTPHEARGAAEYILFQNSCLYVKRRLEVKDKDGFVEYAKMMIRRAESFTNVMKGKKQ